MNEQDKTQVEVGGMQPAESKETSKGFKRSGDIFRIPLSKVKIEDGFNHRASENFGDLEMLANSLEQHGQLEPAFGFKDNDGNVILTTGHRRYAAWHEVAKRTKTEPEMLIMFKGKDNVTRLVLQFTENMQHPNTEFERAKIIEGLLAEGLDKKEVITKLGISQPTFYSLKKLLEMPEEVQAHLRSGELSGTTAVSIYAAVKGDAEALKTAVAQAIENKNKEGKKKATARHAEVGKTRTVASVLKTTIGKLEGKAEEEKASKTELFALSLFQKLRDKVSERTLLDFIRNAK